MRLDENVCPRCAMPHGEHVRGCLEAEAGVAAEIERILPGLDEATRNKVLKGQLEEWLRVFPALTPRVAKAVVIADATREAIKDHIQHMSRTEASLTEAAAEVERLRARVESLEIQLADAKGES